MEGNNLKLSFRPGRTGEDNWESLQSEDIEFWDNSIPLICSRTYVHDDCKVALNADWMPVVRKLKRRYKYFQKLYSRDDASLKIFPDTVDVPVSVQVSGKDKLSEYWWYPNFFLEHYSYEIFIIMNLSRPGSCDFFNLFLIGNDFAASKNKYKKEEARLSAYNFEYAWEESLTGQFPTLTELPISEVIEWYGNINIGVKQKASKPIEKTLFSLYHICKADGDLSAVVWVFHALEALFSTRVGEGFSNLIARISMVLSLNAKQTSILKQNLRKLYNMRSSLIHGGYEVYHPMRREVVDRSIDSQFGEIYDNLQFGISIIIASLQALIKQGWYGIEVLEEVHGKTQP